MEDDAVVAAVAAVSMIASIPTSKAVEAGQNEGNEHAVEYFATRTNSSLSRLVTPADHAEESVAVCTGLEKQMRCRTD